MIRANDIISSLCSRTLLVCLAMLLSLGASAQGDEKTIGQIIDSTKVHKKTRFFENITIGVDAVGPIMRKLHDRGDYQAYVQMNINGKYLPVIEVGYGSADYTDEVSDVSYKAKAPFGRIGCDFNILKNKHDDYRFTVGLRYGFTKFNYDTTLAPDSVGTRVSLSEKCTLHWAELAFSVDAKIWGPLHMGWSFRYRRRLKASAYTYDPQYAPGFGDVDSGTQLMALYTIALRL